MSDTTSIQSALSQRLATEKRAEQKPNLELVKIPQSLEQEDHPRNLRGKVTRKDHNGTVHIKTDQGEIQAKTEQSIKVQQGDMVNVQIEKGAFPKTAYIRPVAQNLQKTTEQQSVDLTQHRTTINIPPNLSLKDLINGTPVSVEFLLPQDLQNITLPYIENISTTLSTALNISVLESPLLSSDIPSNDLLQALPNSPHATTGILSETTFSVFVPPDGTKYPPSSVMHLPVTKIPLSMQVARSISNPAIEPIIFDLQSPNTTTPSTFLEVNVDGIASPQSNMHHSDNNKSQDIPREQAGEIRAKMIGFTKEKHAPILRITTPESHANQHYALQAPVEDISLGADLKLHITKTAKALPANTQITTADLSILNQTHFLTPAIWPVMQDTQQALTQASPKVAQAFGNIIPNASTPNQLGTATMFFLAAMRTGDVQNWIGEKAIDTLKRAGKNILLSRLGQDISTISRISSEPVSQQEWRSLSLPLAWQNDIHKIILHYRQEKENHHDVEENNGTKTRFIMNLNLNNMGNIQLDGLFVGNSKNIGRLDIVLRTEERFSQAIKVEMRKTYKNALSETNFTGELSFQDRTEQWIHITPNIKSDFSEDI